MIFVAKLEAISPADCQDGTYHKRGIRVYPYLRDNVFPDIQKFNKALRIVYSSQPTGVTEEEKVFMAIAIHCKETKQMEYQYKNYQPSSWKNHAGWVHLSKIPKFAYSSHTLVPEEPSATMTGEVDSTSEASVVSTSVSTPTSMCTSMSSRGSGRGQKAAIAANLKTAKEERKRKRDDDKDMKFAAFVDDMSELKSIIKKKSMSTILTRASNTTTDPEIKKKLDDKLIKLALEFVDE